MGRLMEDGRAMIVKCREAHNNIGKLVKLVKYFPAASPENQYGTAFWLVATIGDDYLVRADGQRVYSGLFSPAHLTPMDTLGGRR